MVTLADTSTDAYRAKTERCAVVDRSERGKLALTGAEAKEFMQGQVTNDVEALEPGSGCYAAFLTHKGKMLGDLRILDTGDELLLDCERGLLSLVGPGARAVAGDVPAAEHAHRVATVSWPS